MEKNCGNIYYICPARRDPAGGVKQLYRHVDILNKNGFSAFILHAENGYRCVWFENNTKIAYKSDLFPHEHSATIKQFLLSPFLNPGCALIFIAQILRNAKFRAKYYKELKDVFTRFLTQYKHKDIKIGRTDYLVVPEIYGMWTSNIERGVRKIIFNQNAFYTFNLCSPYREDMKNIAYFDKDVIASIAVSEHNCEYLKYAFPKLALTRIHYGVDTSIFKYTDRKKNQIAFMPRKLNAQVEQVLNLLKARARLLDFEFVPIDAKTEAETARILQESLIFLSFSTQEGCPMPPIEAMACGCVVIGYHGCGGVEYFKEEFSYPIQAEDVLNFAKTVEMVIEKYRHDKDSIMQKGKKASEFVRNNYSMEREESEVISFWRKIFSENNQRDG